MSTVLLSLLYTLGCLILHQLNIFCPLLGIWPQNAASSQAVGLTLTLSLLFRRVYGSGSVLLGCEASREISGLRV